MYVCTITPQLTNSTTNSCIDILLFLQEIENGMWHVDSMSGTTPEGYTITRCQMTTCTQCASESSTCIATECNCLCIHMYKCDSKCYTFNNGHICKHIHRVHSILQKKQLHDQQAESTETQCSVQEDCEQCEITENTAHSSIVYADSVSDPQIGTYHIAQKFDGEKYDESDMASDLIIKIFPSNLFPINAYPMKSTINSSNFYLSKFCVCPILQTFIWIAT